MVSFETAVFGNRAGSHQLLTSSLPLNSSVLDTLRFLVDRPAGHIESEVKWYPYWGCQSIDRWWVLWRGEEDQAAPRKNMVTANVVLVPMDQCAAIDDIDEIFASVGYVPRELPDARILRLAGSIVDWLASGKGPAIVSDISIAPDLIRAIWPRLWDSARAALSFRTLFGVESLDSVPRSSIVVVPAELRPRWHGQHLLDGNDSADGPAARWFAGEASSIIDRLIVANAAHLPGDVAILGRIERIAGRLERINAGAGALTDALVVVRTQEAFDEGLVLPSEDMQAVTAALDNIESATVNEIRTASLVRLDAILEPNVVESALARWAEAQLPALSTEDAFWILVHQAGDAHATWWRRGIGAGIDSGCRARSRTWATAIWRWWMAHPESVPLISARLDRTHETGDWLAKNTPPRVDDDLVSAIAHVCRERCWATVLARSLGSTRPLADCVVTLKNSLPNPEAGLEVLLVDRSADEIVDAAAATCWPPVVVRAASFTVAKPQLFARVLTSSGLVPLLLSHLSQGGEFPPKLIQGEFLVGLFDGVCKGNEASLKIIEYLDERAGRFLLDHRECERILSHVSSKVVKEMSEEWWRRFLANDSVGRPPPALCEQVLKSARSRTDRSPVTLVISLLRLFPEITEADFEEWMRDTGFLWEEGDHKRMGDLLVERKWTLAAKALRWSWKRELKLVAWYAQDLLSWFDRFWGPPEGVVPTTTSDLTMNGKSEITRIDVGIITMKEEEYEALLDKFAPAETINGNNRDYDVAAINTPKGVCRVAITRCVQQGNAQAQSTATELLSDINPKFVLVVGIAGGVPTKDFCLGDVVISSYIQDLTLEDSGTDPTRRQFDALGGPLDTSATRIVERLRAIERDGSPWNEADTIGLPRPSLGGQHTTDDAQWNADITAALQQHAGRIAPIATAKKIASSDRLIKDPELLKTWRKALKGISAVEMESAGVYVPCQRNHVPVLAIRGISDIVGWKRDEAWTLYACHTAAAYVRMLVGAGVFVS